MNRRYVFVTDLSESLAKLIFRDLEELSDVDIIPSRSHYPKTKIGKIASKIIFSSRINKIIHLPFHWKMSGIKKYHFNDDIEYIVIFTNNALSHNDNCVREKLRKRKNLKLVLVLLDSLEIETKYGEQLREVVAENNNWDAIYTYDFGDSKKYNLEYLNECYYSDLRSIKGDKNTSDVYFAGRIKPGKEEIIKKLVSFFNLNKIKYDIKLWLKPGDEKYCSGQLERYNIETFSEPKDYSSIISELQGANCILEILQNNQEAPSLRYYEAVLFNKKLLTNNKNIKKLNFYNPAYMKMFKDPGDIDIEWLKKKETVNYNYNGEFSPKNLIKMIDNKFKTEKQQ